MTTKNKNKTEKNAADETKSTHTHNLYPFLTKAQILERLAADVDFQKECTLIIHSKQTPSEQGTFSTREKNLGGWASSDAVRMGKVAQKLVAMESLTDEESSLMQLRIPSYVKQIAAHFRADAMEKNPTLADSAKAFFRNVAG